VSHGGGAFELLQGLLVENVGDMALGFLDAKPIRCGGDDPRRLLAAVLECVKAQVGESRRIGMCEDPEDAALVVEAILHGCMSLSMEDHHPSRSSESSKDMASTPFIWTRSRSPPVIPRRDRATL